MSQFNVCEIGFSKADHSFGCSHVVFGGWEIDRDGETRYVYQTACACRGRRVSVGEIDKTQNEEKNENICVYCRSVIKNPRSLLYPFNNINFSPDALMNFLSFYDERVVEKITRIS